jgi:flagellar biosynthetic protein FliR
MSGYTDQLVAALLVSLRIAPTLSFAPPFTLLRMPVIVRLILSLSLAACIVEARPAIPPGLAAASMLVPTAVSELVLGLALSLGLQLAFAAMLTAGRAIDFQVGFGLAVLADPTLRTQMPLVGTLFAYGAGAVFFATSGPGDLIAIWSHSLDRIPIGGFLSNTDLSTILAYISSIFAMGIGLAGLVLATLFLIDLAIAFVSRTLPQMNVLVLGFQVKTIAMLATLPFVFALSGAMFLRMVRAAIDMTARLS